MKNHEPKTWKVESQLVDKSAGTHQSVLWCFPCHIPASLDQVGCDRPGPPAFVEFAAVENWKIGMVSVVVER